MAKICTKCKQTKELVYFYNSKKSKDGKREICKKCEDIRNKTYNKKNEEYLKQKQQKKYSIKKEEYRKYNREYYATNREKESLRKKKFREKNREHYLHKQKEYDKKRRKKINEYNKRKKETDPVYKLKSILRDRFNKAVKNNYKSGSAIRDLGCSIEELKFHLEKQFKEGMTWDNYGIKENTRCWEIDHIRPFCSIDITDREQLLKILHYTNLQPLWREENRSKQGKIME